MKRKKKMCSLLFVLFIFFIFISLLFSVTLFLVNALFSVDDKRVKTFHPPQCTIQASPLDQANEAWMMYNVNKLKEKIHQLDKETKHFEKKLPVHEEARGNKTLVVYAFYEKNEEYKKNFLFFLATAVKESPDVDFLFIITKKNSSIKTPTRPTAPPSPLVNLLPPYPPVFQSAVYPPPFPLLPSPLLPPNFSNVFVFHRENFCYDFGSWKYGLDQMNITQLLSLSVEEKKRLYSKRKKVSDKRTKAADNEEGEEKTLKRELLSKMKGRTKYSKFLFINTSVKGPFIPKYYHDDWTNIFTGMINSDVKLAGMSINCHFHPHVQSMLWATDEIGLTLLLNDPFIFSCIDNESKKKNNSPSSPPSPTPNVDEFSKVVAQSEVRMSKLIIEMGYNIDSLLMRYANVDWRNKSFWNCNWGDHPLVTHFLDGTSPHWLETVFLKDKFLFDSAKDDLHGYQRFILQGQIDELLGDRSKGADGTEREKIKAKENSESVRLKERRNEKDHRKSEEKESKGKANNVSGGSGDEEDDGDIYLKDEGESGEESQSEKQKKAHPLQRNLFRIKLEMFNQKFEKMLDEAEGICQLDFDHVFYILQNPVMQDDLLRSGDISLTDPTDVEQLRRILNEDVIDSVVTHFRNVGTTFPFRFFSLTGKYSKDPKCQKFEGRIFQFNYNLMKFMSSSIDNDW